MRLLFLILLSFTSLFAYERIVTLSPSITEIVFELGVGAEVVGVSDYSSYPIAAEKLEKVGGYAQPSLERILKQRPTVVIGHLQHSELLKQLEHFHVKTINVELSHIENIKDSIAKLGVKLNKSKKAKAMIDEIDKSIKEAKKVKTNKDVLIVYGARESLKRQNFIAGHDMFFEDILKICGASNAYKSEFQNQPVLTLEGIIATNPDKVLILHSCASNGGIDDQKIKDMWNALPINSSKTKSVEILKDNYLLIPSHRIAKSITKICEEVAK
ncbi:MAG: ABC transporter substrate-binding protein [Helicobacteraceae bacterium]|nr:ABC transporter substrate-binding protein [Helicobacteraceae bacterium]